MAIAALLPSTSRAGSTAELAAPFSYGGQQIALLAGSAFAVPIFGSNRREIDHTHIVGLFPRWAIGLSDPLARGAFYEGNVELDVQPMVLLNFDHYSGWVAGGSLLLHYNFLRGGRIVPFVEGGAGASYLAFHLRDQADGLTYPLEASLGFHVLSFLRGAVTASVGYYHLSNARRRYPNLGVNAVMIRLGLLAFTGDFAPRPVRPLAGRGLEGSRDFEGSPWCGTLDPGTELTSI